MATGHDKIAAIIPVRAGSRRLKNKNILPFGDSNLLVHKIRQLKLVPEIDAIIVTSDSDEMLAMAEAEGVRTHKRPPEYCDEESKSFGDLVAFLASTFDEFDTIAWTPCVCPLVPTRLYSQAIEKYRALVLEQGKYDSVVSSKLFKEYLWDEHRPLNYGLGAKHVPSQKLPDWHVIVNGFYIAPRTDMIKWSFLSGENPYRFILEKKYAVDIDDAEDFEIAKALLGMQS